MGYSPWGHKESNPTGDLAHTHSVGLGLKPSCSSVSVIILCWPSFPRRAAVAQSRNGLTFLSPKRSRTQVPS